MVELEIGTQPKTYRFLFDTGSATSWVADATCSKECLNDSGYERVGYDATTSSTGILTGESGEIIYSSDRIAGLTASDEWNDGYSFAWTQKLIAANQSTWRFIPGDGFLGLAFSTISNGGAPTVVETLIAQDKLAEPKFGIYYPPGRPLNTNGTGQGLLTIGASKEHKYVDGNLIKVPIVRGGPNDDYEVWRSVILGVEGSYTSDAGVITNNTSFDFGNVVFDTGEGNINIAADKVEAVYESIGMNYTAIMRGDVIPLCKEFNSSWSITFRLGPDPFDSVFVALTGDQLARPGFANRADACFPPFSGGDVDGYTLIGTPFLSQFYTIWDFGSKTPQEYVPTLAFGNLKKAGR